MNGPPGAGSSRGTGDGDSTGGGDDGDDEWR